MFKSNHCDIIAESEVGENFIFWQLYDSRRIIYVMNTNTKGPLRKSILSPAITLSAKDKYRIVTTRARPTDCVRLSTKILESYHGGDAICNWLFLPSGIRG